MVENISAQFVRKLHGMAHSAFSKNVLHKARECFVDYLSVVIGGCKIYADINHQYAVQNKLSGHCHVFGLSKTFDLKTAVMMNAFNAHVLELDDSHRVAMTHLGAPIFSALVGVAEIYDCTVEQMLKASIVGYEAAIRLANAIQPGHKKRGFHVSGTCCTVGSAIGISAMLDDTEAEMENVLSAAATSAAGLLAVISGRSEQKPYNVANAAVAGADAALYGKFFTGAVDILNDSRGFLRAMTDEFHINKLLAEGYAMEGIYQKLYAACRHCHAPMEAMLKIRSENELSVNDIETIEVRTYDLAINGHIHTEITGVSSAKQSIPYGVAVACIYGDCGISAFTNQMLEDKQVLELTKKVRVFEDKELTNLVPEKRAAIVTVKCKNGLQCQERVDYPKGEPENPITKEEWNKKIYTLTENANLDDDIAKEIFDFAWHADNAPVSEIFGWL